LRHVAKVLAQTHYATAPEAAYRSGMERASKTIAEQLGPSA
jgi:hypothetical protein